MPISAADCLTGRDLTEPRVSPDGTRLAYVRTDVDGARIIVCTTTGRHESPDETRDQIRASPWMVRPGRALGGGTFDWMPDGREIVAVTALGELRRWIVEFPPDSSDSDVLVGPTQGGITSPVPSPDGSQIAFVVDQARILTVDPATGSITRVDDGRTEFAIDPVWWKGELIWHGWSPPHMPWDESVLLSSTGVVRKGGSLQHQQPQTSTDGTRLGWLDDASGWLNVVIEGFGRVNEEFEHGGPTWGDRQRSWCFDPSGRRVAFVRNENGFGRLCTIDLETGTVVERAKAVHGQLTWRGTFLAAVRTGGRTPTQIVVYDTTDETWTRSTIEVGSMGNWETSTALVEPELVSVAAGERFQLHARLYRSVQARGRLLCWMHGGPTDQWQVTFMPRLAYWLDRGYDVLIPDVRGSTGHGRAYTQALRGHWGEIDVEDARMVLEDVLTRYGYAGRSVAIMGSSAGGLTALSLAARSPHLCSAVVSSYPVTDIAALEGASHRFEAHYNRSLVGSLNDTARLSRERSPLFHIEELLRTPILLFHGSADQVVPVSQSRRFVDELRSRGGDVDFVVFDGEGHGFRRIENKVDEFERTERFLESHMG